MVRAVPDVRARLRGRERDHQDITFGKIDTEDQQGLAGAAKISSIPTLMAFRDGVLVFSQAGALPPRRLRSSSRQSKGLDMDDVEPSSPCSSARTRQTRPELPVRRALGATLTVS